MSNTVELQRCMLQNYLLLWLDDNISNLNQDFQNILAQFRNVVQEVNVFTQPDECVDFLTEIDDRRVFLIVTRTLSKQLVPLIHDISQLHRIYIFSGNETSYKEWTKQWIKIQGFFTEIKPLCDSLNTTAHECDYDMIPISFVSKQSLEATTVSDKQNLDQLEPTYMYSMLFKEILLEINDDDVTNSLNLKDLVDYCRQQNVSESQLNNFQQEYHKQSPIWWYTKNIFLYSMLNRVLRTFNTEAMIKMGFFIRKLHRQLEVLQKEQSNAFENPFIVYRGQGLSQQDFQRLLDKKGGLLSFNNFLSTSKEQKVAMAFAERILRQDNGVIGVLFIMTIDSASTTPFALIEPYSAIRTEQEILFSMHSVFRVVEIKPSVKNNRLWEVKLTFTNDNDPHLAGLTKRMEKEIDGKGWYRMGKLMIKVGHFDRAEVLFNELLKKATNEIDIAFCYHQFGEIKIHQGQYKEATSFYEKSLEIKRKTLKEDDPSLANTYNNIGLAYEKMSQYMKALEFYEKSIKIKKIALSSNDPDLALSYNNIGGVYQNMGDYLKALKFYEKAHQIFEMALPPNHPTLASSYNNIGLVYSQVCDYTKALEFYEKARKIWEIALPQNHPEFAISYNNIAMTYYKIGNYSKAVEFHEKSITIKEIVIPPNYPSLATSYSNIGIAYDSMGDYSKALEFHEKALKIREKALHPNHHALSTSYNNIGQVYNNMGDISEAFKFFEKAHTINLQVLPPNHPSLATSYNNIGQLYYNMGNISEAFEFIEKAHKINLQVLPPNHPSLATSYNNIGQLYYSMGDYLKALELYGKSREILEITLPPNHYSLANSYSNIGTVYHSMSDYPKALQFLEKAYQIFEQSLPSNHPYIKVLKDTINDVKKKM